MRQMSRQDANAAFALSSFLYGGNAFLYHMTLSEYEQLLDWLSGFGDNLWAIPSLGPSYGRAMDQASLRLRCAHGLVTLDPDGCAGRNGFSSSRRVRQRVLYRRAACHLCVDPEQLPAPAR